MITLDLDQCLATIAASGERLVEAVERAGLDAPCATCRWDGRALLAHQAMVHRWAAAHVAGDDPDALPNQTTLIADVDDLPAYYREGLAALLDTLAAAPDDLVAMTFLKDAPPPKLFWARRQVHETTIHMVDALSAELARVPSSEEAAIGRQVAVDGIDEILCGFFTRGKSKLYDGVEFDVLVAPDDSPHRWLVHVAEKLSVSPTGEAPVVVTGSAEQIYLGLWNRGDLQVAGDEQLASRWRSTQRVGWS